jgi:hypothetical protein
VDAAPSERFVPEGCASLVDNALGWGDNPVTSIGFLTCFMLLLLLVANGEQTLSES